MVIVKAMLFVMVNSQDLRGKLVKKSMYKRSWLIIYAAVIVAL